MPTREEFVAEFRGPLLLLLAEAWACRKASPSELGLLMDQHALAIRRLQTRMYDFMNPQEPAAVNGTANGIHRSPVRKQS